MLKERHYKNFAELQTEIRESFDPMLSVRDVRNIIGCSWNFVIQLIIEGKLEAFDITGKTIDRESINENSHGLRITPSSLSDYLDSTKLK